MAEQIQIENAARTLFTPINRNYAPFLEDVRTVTIYYMFDPERALNAGRFIQVRFEGDEVGQDSGPDIDVTERFLVSLRFFDLINKTELKSIFINVVEWFEDYDVPASKRLRQVFNVFSGYKDRLEAIAKKELLKLGVPEPTINMIMPYLDTDDPVNFVSACCTIIFLACLASAGNRSLIPFRIQ